MNLRAGRAGRLDDARPKSQRFVGRRAAGDRRFFAGCCDRDATPQSRRGGGRQTSLRFVVDRHQDALAAQPTAGTQRSIGRSEPAATEGSLPQSAAVHAAASAGGVPGHVRPVRLTSNPLRGTRSLVPASATASRNRWPKRTWCRRRPIGRPRRSPAVQLHRGAIRCVRVSNARSAEPIGCRRSRAIAGPPGTWPGRRWRNGRYFRANPSAALRAAAVPDGQLFVLARPGPFVTVPPALDLSRRSVWKTHGRPAIPIFFFRSPCGEAVSPREGASTMAHRLREFADWRTADAATSEVGSIADAARDEDKKDGAGATGKLPKK